MSIPDQFFYSSNPANDSETETETIDSDEYSYDEFSEPEAEDDCDNIHICFKNYIENLLDEYVWNSPYDFMVSMHEGRDEMPIYTIRLSGQNKLMVIIFNVVSYTTMYEDFRSQCIFELNCFFNRYD